MSVDARVLCISKVVYGAGTEYEHVEVRFVPDPNGTRHNKQWAAAMAALHLTITVKPEVARLFGVNRAVTLTLEPDEPD